MDSYTVSYKDKEVGYYNAYDDGTAAYYTAWGSPWDMEDELRELGLDKESYWWYLELRKYGSCPHSGFGLGFARLLMFVTGMANIRDVIPFPRTPNNAEF